MPEPSWHIPHMNYFTILLAILLSPFFTAPGVSFGESPDKTGMYTELGGKRSTATERGVVAGDIGIEHFDVSDHVSVRGGLSFYATDEKPDVLTGFDLGLRLHAGAPISPFIGVGLFAGSSEQEVPAENDGIDNNNDGFIDERGETETVVKDVMAAFYPEAGVQIWFTRDIGLAFSAKYHMTTEGSEYRYWIRSLGFFIRFR